MSTTTPIHIGYAEDHALVRKGIAGFINTIPGCSICIEGSNGQELLEQLEQAETLPELCILDIFMPVMNGLETLVHIKERWPGMKVLILTAHDTEYYLPQVLRAGANGYLLKDCEPEELKNAIFSICEHGVYSSDATAQKFYRSVVNKEIQLPEFSDMEIALLRYCCSDLSYAQIADQMHTTLHSVDWYRNSLFKKLHVGSRSGLVMYAIQFGIVQLDIDVTARSVVLKQQKGNAA